MITYNVVVSNKANIITAIKQVYGYYDIIRILNSNPRDLDLCNALQKFDIEYYEREFDNIGNQARYLLSKSKIGEWFHFAGDDCLPSLSLLENLASMVNYCENHNLSSIWLPYIRETEGTRDRSEIGTARIVYAMRSEGIAEKHGFSKVGIHGSAKLFKVFSDTKIVNDIHEGAVGIGQGLYYSPYAIIHKKAYDGYLVSALWQSLHDKNGYWNSVKNGDFVRQNLWEYAKESGIESNLDSILRHFEKGAVSNLLKKWIMDNKDNESHYIYPWFVMYYLVYHPEELPKDFWDCRLLNILIDAYLGFENEAQVLEMDWHEIIKELFIARGITRIARGCIL